ncbi:MAG: hypothetical protein AAGA95_20115 [Pseudomonadota bacterium]
MITRNTAVASLLTALTASYPQLSKGQNITNSDFLSWPEARQSWWVISGVMMAGHVTHRRDAAKGSCIWDWYLDAPDERLAQLKGTMRDYPDHLPTGIVIAWLEKACGSLED